MQLQVEKKPTDEMVEGIETPAGQTLVEGEVEEHLSKEVIDIDHGVEKISAVEVQQIHLESYGMLPMHRGQVVLVQTSALGERCPR